MAGISRFEEIHAWQTGRELTRAIYALTRQAGFDRDFGLRDQIRRAAVSTISNIAEGFESRTDTQFIQFLGTAKASAGEVRAQLYAALDQQYLTEEQFKEAYDLADKCGRQLAKFIQYLISNPHPHRISEEWINYEP
jgi:four helix bundle protein